MTRKIKGSFSALNPKAKIFEEINNRQPNWWNLLCKDKELYIDFRKDNYIGSSDFFVHKNRVKPL